MCWRLEERRGWRKNVRSRDCMDPCVGNDEYSLIESDKWLGQNDECRLLRMKNDEANGLGEMIGYRCVSRTTALG